MLPGLVGVFINCRGPATVDSLNSLSCSSIPSSIGLPASLGRTRCRYRLGEGRFECLVVLGSGGGAPTYDKTAGDFAELYHGLFSWDLPCLCDLPHKRAEAYFSNKNIGSMSL